MDHIFMAIFFILYIVALVGGVILLILAIASHKRDKYYLLKSWYYCRGTANYTEYECPYCFKHIKIYDHKLPDHCSECHHKVRNEEDKN